MRDRQGLDASFVLELEAALDSDSHNILLLPGVYALTQTLSISRSVALRAEVAGQVVLDGQGSVQVMDISGAIEVSIERLHITNGYESSVRAAD